MTHVIRIWAVVGFMSWAAVGGDWPRFRGPNGCGVDAAANPPAAFTENDFAWKLQLPGIGHSSPVVIGKRAFLTSADDKSADRFVLAVDLDSGKILWQKKYESRTFKQNRDNSYASATCAADAQRVIVSFIAPESYKVYAFDHDGKELWTYDMGPWNSEHGCGASPIMHDGVVVLANDQLGPTASLVALDAASGKLKWKIDRKPGVSAHSTPCIFKMANGQAQIILTCTMSQMTSIDLATGKQNWAVEMNPKLRCVGSVGSNDKYCAAMCGVGGTSRAGAVVEPDPSDATKVKVLHKIPTGAVWPYVPTPVFKDDLMFLWSDNGGTVSCLKSATGEKLWQERVGGDYYASPIIAGDKLYNISKTGQVMCLSASAKFEILGKSELGIKEKSFATPAIAGNRLLFRTESWLICVGK